MRKPSPASFLRSGYTTTELKRIELKITDRIEQAVGGPQHFDQAWALCPHKMHFARRIENVLIRRTQEAQR